MMGQNPLCASEGEVSVMNDLNYKVETYVLWIWARLVKCSCTWKIKQIKKREEENNRFIPEGNSRRRPCYHTLLWNPLVYWDTPSFALPYEQFVWGSG